MDVTSTSPIGRKWGWVFALGLVVCLAGIAALFTPALVTLSATFVIGFLLVVSGILEAVEAFQADGPRSRRLVTALGGILAILAGVLILLRPVPGVAALTLVFGVYVFLAGIFRGVTAIVDRHDAWGWDVAYGVLAVVLAGIILASWPADSIWFLGTVVAIEIFTRGVLLMAAALVVRRIGKELEAPV